MAIDRQARTAPAPGYARTTLIKRLTGGGTTGNERLTAATGVLLLVLLAVIGVTILRLRPLLSVHLFVGMLLDPTGAAEDGHDRLPVLALLHRTTLPTDARGRHLRCCACSRRW